MKSGNIGRRFGQMKGQGPPRLFSQGQMPYGEYLVKAGQSFLILEMKRFFEGGIPSTISTIRYYVKGNS